MTPEEAKASLGIATMLQDRLMPQMQQPMEEAPQGQETQESAPEQAQEPEQEEMAMEEEMPQESQDMNEMGKMHEDMKKGMDEFKGEVKGIIESKFDDLTKAIRESLKD